jgi:uroporphyrinogen III methyltransferase/synthase
MNIRIIMKDTKTVLLTGIRDSKLSQSQTEQALKNINSLLPDIGFKVKLFSTPGDRDRKLDLREAPEDFFTKDLDDALLNKNIDLAIHSAKDLPSSINPELDFFFLPWKEDPRDVIVLPKGKSKSEVKTIGVSSERRADYCRKYLPDAQLLPVRGNIEQRIEQMDNGKFDMLIMAAAGLKRLGLENRISEYISLDKLQVPEAQGVLAVTFRKNDKRLKLLRQMFIKSVVFAGAGIGNRENITIAVKNAMSECNVCLYDALIPENILKYLNRNAVKVPVGKRAGHHSMQQQKISELTADYAKKGFKTLRLKGGDPTLFGRLAEETELLSELSIPFEVLPGISTLSTAAAQTGIIPTRRGVSRGCTIATIRQGSPDKIRPLTQNEITNDFTKVFFMSISHAETLFSSLISEGNNPETPAAVIFNAGSPDAEVITGTLKNISSKMPASPSAPGIIITGPCADSKFLFPKNGLLADSEILVTASERINRKTASLIRNYGGIPIEMPLIKLEPTDSDPFTDSDPVNFDFIIIPSPGAAQLFIDFLKSAKIDLRKIPAIAVSGPETAAVLHRHGIYPELVPSHNFGAEGLIEKFAGIENISEITICRLVSDKAPRTLTDELEKLGASVTEIPFYKNSPVKYSHLPECSCVIFASPSAVKSFKDNFPDLDCKNITAAVIGKPTRSALNGSGLDFRKIIQPVQQDIRSLVQALAADKLMEAFNELQ